MHLRGKSFQLRLHYPDGRTQLAFDIPRYNFDWQQTYRLREPINVPKNTVAEFIATYDNSSGNPFNPDPTKDVVYGLRTQDEMMSADLGYVNTHEQLDLNVINGRVVFDPRAR